MGRRVKDFHEYEVTFVFGYAKVSQVVVVNDIGYAINHARLQLFGHTGFDVKHYDSVLVKDLGVWS